jgi:hypothetical protein
MNAVIDHFGTDVEVEERDEEHFSARVRVCASPDVLPVGVRMGRRHADPGAGECS